MNLAEHVTQTLTFLQELVTTHLLDLHPPHSSRDSHQYRLLIFVIYSHMRSLLNATGSHFPAQEPGWDQQFIQIIETIHFAFGTRQIHPYDQWPTRDF